MFWFLIYRKDAQDLKAACCSQSDEDAIHHAGIVLNVDANELECIQHSNAAEMAERNNLPVIVAP